MYKFKISASLYEVIDEHIINVIHFTKLGTLFVLDPKELNRTTVCTFISALEPVCDMETQNKCIKQDYNTTHDVVINHNSTTPICQNQQEIQ